MLLVEFIEFAVEVGEGIVVRGWRGGASLWSGCVVARISGLSARSVGVGLGGKASKGVIERGRGAGDARDVGQSEMIEISVGVDQFLIGGEILCEGVFLGEFEFKAREIRVGAGCVRSVACCSASEKSQLPVFVEMKGLLTMSTGCA